MKERASTDATLVDRARRGDPSAFDALVRRHYRAAYSVALAVLGRQADAEDTCQEAWVLALEKLEQCRQPERFLFWLLQIVRNQARNQLTRRRVRAAMPLEEHDVAGREDPHRDLERLRLREELEGALAKLPEIQREIVLLHDMHGWKHHGLAQLLGLTDVMSRQHLFQARRRLRALLSGKTTGEENHDH
jgi:RNA polymerase sigma-70 factor, ECF subfamily